ncbi:hypothetical protein, partial [Haloferax profundi]|uniref:hypothetical protein n=1 Tax=Haloferax profundi TaxID=1544718 RepID=UPI000AE4687C
HILVGTAIQFGLGPRTASFLAVGVPVTVLSIGVSWYFARLISGIQAAQVTALVVAASDAVIMFAVAPQTTTLGFSLLVLIFVLRREFHLTASYLKRFLLGVTMSVVWFTLLFTHQVYSVIGLVSILTLSMTDILVNLRSARNRVVQILLSVTSLYFAWTVTRYSGTTSSKSVFDAIGVILLSKIDSLFTPTVSSFSIPAGLNASLSGSASLSIIQILGSSIVFILGATGLLYTLQTKLDVHSFQIYGLVGFLFVFIFGGPLIGLSNIYPFRWFPLTLALLSVGVGAFVSQINSSNTHTQLSVGIILLLIVSLMGGSYLGSYDDPVFDGTNGAQAFEVSEPDLAMASWSHQHNGDTSVIGDRLFSIIVSRWFGDNQASTLHYIYDEKRIAANSDTILLAEREYMSSGHAQYDLTVNKSSAAVLGQLPGQVRRCTGDKVYTSDRSSNILRTSPQCNV